MAPACSAQGALTSVRCMTPSWMRKPTSMPTVAAATKPRPRAKLAVTMVRGGCAHSEDGAAGGRAWVLLPAGGAAHEYDVQRTIDRAPRAHARLAASARSAYL
jgi:hypothetical protein